MNTLSIKCKLHALNASRLPISQVHSQRGAVLLITMIFLVLIALASVSALGSSKTNIQIVGNAQFRQEASAAAQKAIEEVLSSDEFLRLPEQVAATPINIDVTGDSVSDFAVNLTPAPSCFASLFIMNSELDPAVDDDVPCFKSSNINDSSGVDGAVATGFAAPGTSMCASTRWDVAATVDDVASSTKAEVHQGVSARAAAEIAENFCK